jgi:hypothetical protein
MVPKAIVNPLTYLFDIIKDTLQLALLIMAIGGLGYFFKNWSSFASVVSTNKLFLMIIFLLVKCVSNSFNF